LLDFTTIIIAVTTLFIFVALLIAFFSFVVGERRIEDLQTLVEKGRYKEALPKLMNFLEKNETNIRAHYLLGICQRKEKEYNEAALSFRQALKTTSFPTDIPEKKIRKMLAQTYEEMGHVNEAKNEYLILTTIDPDNYEPFQEVGRLFLNARHFTRASNFLTKATTLNAKSAEAWSLLGQAQYYQKSYQDAKTSLFEAVKMRPENLQTHYYLGLCARYSGDYEMALRELERAEKDESLREKAILGKGMVYMDQFEYSRAVTEMERGLKFASKGSDISIDMRYLLALAAEKNRDYAIAVENWEEIERIKAGFRDVRDKLKQYAEFRTHDAIKDFVIANVVNFENICRRIIENMNYHVAEFNVINDNTIRALVTEKDPQKKLLRKNYTLIQIQRDMNPLTEKSVRDFQEYLKTTHAIKGIMMITAEISPGALSFASTRPIDLFDATRMVSLIDAAI
jgi:tetratricopeptide (TPR) repeat protein